MAKKKTIDRETFIEKAMLTIPDLACWKNKSLRPTIDRTEALRELTGAHSVGHAFVYINQAGALKELTALEVQAECALEAFGRHLALGNLGVVPGPGTVSYPVVEKMREWQQAHKQKRIDLCYTEPMTKDELARWFGYGRNQAKLVLAKYPHEMVGNRVRMRIKNMPTGYLAKHGLIP